MVTLNLKFKERTEKIVVPSTWYDIPFFHYLEINNILKKGTDKFELAEVITGCPAQNFRNSRAADFVIVESLLTDLIKSNLEIKKPIERIKIANKVFPLPTIENLTAGQFEDARLIIFQNSKDAENFVALYPKILAIIFGNVLHSEYDASNIDNDSEYFRNMNCVDVLCLGAFFLMKLSEYYNGMRKDSPNLRIRIKKFGQDLKRFMRNLVRLHV